MILPPISLRKIPLKAGILGPNTLFFAFFHTFLALFGLVYGLFGPVLTLFNTKTSFLAPLGIFSGEGSLIQMIDLDPKWLMIIQVDSIT